MRSERHRSDNVEQLPAELEVTHRVEGDRLIVTVTGELDLHSATALQRDVDALSPFPHPVTLDLGGVGFIDSTGIRALLAVNARATETTGSPVTIANPTESTRRLLELTGIDRVFQLES
jgi:anti-anti-sigma factor